MAKLSAPQRKVLEQLTRDGVKLCHADGEGYYYRPGCQTVRSDVAHVLWKKGYIEGYATGLSSHVTETVVFDKSIPWYETRYRITDAGRKALEV